MASFQNHRRYRYLPMAAADIQRAMDELDLSVQFLSFVTGFREDRITMWLDGKDTCHPALPVMLGLLALPGGKEQANAVARTFVDPDTSIEPPRLRAGRHL